MIITIREHPYYVYNQNDPLYTFHSENIPFRKGEIIDLRVNNKDDKCNVKERNGLFKVKDIRHSLLRTYFPFYDENDKRRINSSGNHSVTILVEEIENK